MNDQQLIRQARKSRGWTQQRLAIEMCVERATVCQWENRAIPKRRRDKLYRVLGITCQ